MATSKKEKTSRDDMIWGLILLGLGVIFLLQNLFDIEILSQIWQFWPVVFIAWGVSILAKNRS